MRSVHDRILAVSAVLVPLVLVICVHSWSGLSYLGSGLLGLLLVKILLARRFRSRPEHVSVRLDRRVCLVMPMHNEDPAFVVAALRSIIGQSHPPHRIHVIDDGSTDGGASAKAAEAVLGLESPHADWEVTRLEHNVGKRRALAVGFRADATADVFVCVDSDTVLDRFAIVEGLRPLSDPDVAAVAGFVSAINWRTNVLTRLTDLRYVSAFLAERAAYSFFGAVLCCCGSLSFYRADVVRENLDDFVGQRFLGQPATFGDDRRLTNYALRAGRVVLAERSRAATAVPERLGHYVRQQIRWNKSFIRESAWVLGTFPLTHGAFWLTAIEVIGWAAIGGLMVVTVAVMTSLGEVAQLAPALVLVPIIAYIRNAAYLEHTHRGHTLGERLAVLALAPLYGLLHVVLLIPLRFWALCTLRNTRWGTRSDVEVRFATPDSPDASVLTPV